MTFELLVAPSPARLMERAAALVAAQIRHSVASQGVCRLSLAGGNTPTRLYQTLLNPDAVGEMPFSRVELFFGDERFVPHDHVDSNYRTAIISLHRNEPLFHAVYPMTDGTGNPEDAARAYEAHLQTPLDLLLLGMGPDGHIASIFPDSAVFAHPQRRVMAVTGTKPPPRRITITPRVIAEAGQTFVLVTGREKARTVARVLETPGSVEELPARLVKDTTWLLDAAAASQLSMKCLQRIDYKGVQQ